MGCKMVGLDQSNFEFLNGSKKTQIYLKTAKEAEFSYATGLYNQELVSLRKIAENLAKDIILLAGKKIPDHASFNDYLKIIKSNRILNKKTLQYFYDFKQAGNEAAHQIGETDKDKGLELLKKMYIFLKNYAKNAVKIKVPNTSFVEPVNNTYKPAERKLIYVQTADNQSGKWLAYEGLKKIGDASIDDFEIDGHPNSPDLQNVANKRISQYMKTAGVPWQLLWTELAYRKKDHTWFRDHDVHNVLKRSGVKKATIYDGTTGNEWYKTDLETAKEAIQAVKEGRLSINAKKEPSTEIVLRPEQKKAISDTKKAFKRYDKMLWNAKMRFGKTITSLQLVKEMKFNHVLIMTHRPVVDEGWFEDFKKIGMPEAGYLYGSKKEGETFDKLKNSEKPYVYFASLQDLRGSEIVGGSQGDKNRALFDNDWDLLIIDEAHEGTQTDLAQKVTDLVVTPKKTKVLELSGTPFNIMDQYDENQVFTWDYVMEQEAKYNWPHEHPSEPNPYEGLPKVSMYTFEMRSRFKDAQFISDDRKAFNFKEFFRVDKDGNFYYKDKVVQFLKNIRTPDPTTNYPFSTPLFRERLRHTLWIMPGVKEAAALEKLLTEDEVFGKEYRIINVVKDNDDIASQNDIDKVNAAIGDDPAATKTITLTVRKMTTGVTIKPWTAVLFLSNTNSAIQYLQAAFRAQTPYSSPTFGQKTNCYIFDFAPDRALTVMAQATQLKTGVGKRTTTTQRQQMGHLMNFLPIIGETGQGMKPFNVDKMLSKLKRVYAEKAVRSGFDDDSLYSDELLMLNNADLNDFNHLKAIVGTTKAEKKKIEVDVNHQGLTEEEYETAEHSRKKNRKERTPEEQAAIDKMNALKKQRKTMISVLRSISIRIPLMIYGMDVDIDEDVDIHKFVRLVDDKSWKEFMPKGVTKELFKKFIKYYDPEVFVEAGRIIRRKAKSLDDEDPITRAENLALIFGTFHNPDKETVLTPWRVVNMHLGKTVGGYSFYDSKWQNTTVKGDRANHWIRTPYTYDVFKDNTHILEINSKTGLYPLYMAITLYVFEYAKLNKKTGKPDRRKLWKQILKNNIFVVAKTPMSKSITQRTLAGYKDYDTNILFVDNIVEDAKSDVEAEAKKIGEAFGIMKFDVVIGNPPYQDVSKGDNDTFTPPIYNNFMDLSYQLSDLVTLITPARFLFDAGSTPKDWNKKMLNDPHLKIVQYTGNSSDIFPRTDIKGGVAITLRDANNNYGSIAENYKPAGIFIPFTELKSTMDKVLKIKFKSFSEIVYPRTIYNFTDKMHEDYPEAVKKLSKGHAYDVSSNIFDRLPDVFFEEKPNDGKEYIKIIGRKKAKRVSKFIRKEYIAPTDNLEKYKVFVPAANGSGALGETLSTPMIGKPMIGSTETFMSIGSFDTLEEAEAAKKYVETKFARVLLGILKITQHNPVTTWRLIPMQDFTKNSDIDWTKSISEIDQQLYRKYGLDDDEINFIETKVQAMD